MGILRIEPVPSTDADADDGLMARVHDPLWFFARQWQLGEFQGSDTGSPVFVQIRGTSAPIGAYASGVKNKWHRYDPRKAPLDALVEADARKEEDYRYFVYLGAHFLRLLRAARLGQYVPSFLSSYPCSFLKKLSDPVLHVLALGSIDSAQLSEDLDGMVSGEKSCTNLVKSKHRKRFLVVAKTWLEWYREETIEIHPQSAQCWEPNRLEHHLLIASSLGDGTVLRAREYKGDSMDWLDFDVDLDASSPPFQLPKSETIEVTGIPTPATFGGMPVPRYWELEAGEADFGKVEAGPQDLGRLMLIRFTMVYGNDWFIVPIRLASGSMTKLDEVIVTDVFGQKFSIGPAERSTSEWNLFKLDTTDSPTQTSARQMVPAQEALFLPPSFSLHLESEPLETVRFLRDEMANLAWGVERLITTVEGVLMDRAAQWRRGKALPSSVPESGTESLPKYLVETEVPDYWIPLVPAQVTPDSIKLVLAPLEILTQNDTTRMATVKLSPLGNVLTPSKGEKCFSLYEEEVPRSGITVQTRRRMIRWHGGRVFVWVARQKSVGRGEGSSGLRFDLVIPE